MHVNVMNESMDAECWTVRCGTGYTFMGWHPQAVMRLPHGYGDKFPAFLTWRGGIDYKLIDFMRPLFDKGLYLCSKHES